MANPPGLHVVDAERRPELPRVVLVHGAMDRSASFGRVARQLGDELDLVRYDRRGYGRSAEVGVGTFDDHVDDLVAVLGDEPSHVFGHSIGGVVALAAAERAPERVLSVLAYEAPTPWFDWWPSSPEDPSVDAADVAEAFMRRAIGDRYWERLPARTRADRRSEGPALRADIASLRGEAPFDAARVAQPALSACGSEATWWHERGARALAEQLPQGELVVVAGAGHGAHLTHPTAVAHLVRRLVGGSAG